MNTTNTKTYWILVDEKDYSNSITRTYQHEVPTGYLIRTVTYCSGFSVVAESMVFVPKAKEDV